MAQAAIKLPTAASTKVENPLTLRDALRQASKDPEFARRLIEDPESLKAEYHLSDKTIAEIKSVAGSPLAAFGAQIDKVGSATGLSAQPPIVAGYEGLLAEQAE